MRTFVNWRSRISNSKQSKNILRVN